MKTETRRAKPVSDATQRLLDEMRRDAAPSADKLERARAEVAKLRDLEMESETLSFRLKEIGQDIRHVKEKTLVDIFDEVGIDRLGLPAEGNAPPYEVELAEYYHANIPEERRTEAYGYLTKAGHADLIKTTFVVEFGLRDGKQTAAFERLLEKNVVLYSKKQGVPWNTLTAWFRTEHKRKPLPARTMELIGATVGRVAKVVKQQKEKK